MKVIFNEPAGRAFLKSLVDPVVQGIRQAQKKKGFVSFFGHFFLWGKRLVSGRRDEGPAGQFGSHDEQQWQRKE